MITVLVEECVCVRRFEIYCGVQEVYLSCVYYVFYLNCVVVGVECMNESWKSEMSCVHAPMMSSKNLK